MMQQSSYLVHHGILKQQWGVRNGPPYPLKGGDYSKSELQAIQRERAKKPHSIYNKRHFDQVVKEGTTIQTLSIDPDRTKGKDMFYAVSDDLDKLYYRGIWNSPVCKKIYDSEGNVINAVMCWKYNIQNTITRDINVASEDSGAEVFKKLYKSDRDFYNFVTDPDRMRSLLDDEDNRNRGYKQARKVLEKIDAGETPTSEEMNVAYRMFNLIIPNDGAGNEKVANDVLRQRTKFFNALKEAGYSAVLDTNNTIYDKKNARSAMIVFDPEAFIPKDVKLAEGNIFIGIEWMAKKLASLGQDDLIPILAKYGE